jgi:hypothetical protein
MNLYYSKERQLELIQLQILNLMNKIKLQAQLPKYIAKKYRKKRKKRDKRN